jgi:hypothetical protein
MGQRPCLSKAMENSTSAVMLLQAPPEVFKKTVETKLPILMAIGNVPCVIIPPIPQYLSSRCCDDLGHCTNTNNTNYQEHLLASFFAEARPPNIFSGLVRLTFLI